MDDEINHTPGPWEWHFNPAAGTYEIVSIHGQRCDTFQDRKLQAAAPDMLALLIKSRDQFRYYADLHRQKPDEEKARINDNMADTIQSVIDKTKRR